MSEKTIKKNIKLVGEFDKYLWKNPKLIKQLPKKSTIMITVKGDYYFNRISKAMVKKSMGPRDKIIVEARKEGSRWHLVVPVK